MQSVPEAVDAMFADFSNIFPGGSGDGAKLDIAVLANKPDMDEALIDCMMYDDDDLMSSALKMLESTYGQWGKVAAALSEVTLLEHSVIPVFGSVHVLRAQLSELMNLQRTYTVWGVKSRVSGPFGDDEFGTINFAPLTQTFILEVLRGNGDLCANVSPTLVRLFAHLADSHEDVSISPALDLFFILCKPELAPVREVQNLVCSNLTAYDHGLGLKKFNQAFRRCLAACASKVITVPELASNETSLSQTRKSKLTKKLKSKAQLLMPTFADFHS
jgi:hypothetical protein